MVTTVDDYCYAYLSYRLQVLAKVLFLLLEPTLFTRLSLSRVMASSFSYQGMLDDTEQGGSNNKKNTQYDNATNNSIRVIGRVNNENSTDTVCFFVL